jgi:predicted unusual protein kinase regulating ubiquinone biosynthesis (AarF/ABC1/UbiB family)
MFGSTQETSEYSLEQRAGDLKDLLQRSGSLAQIFGLYLSSRIDLLPAEYCRVLALISDISPALSPLNIQRVIDEELGQSFNRTFQKIDLVSFRSGLIDQTHEAVLSNGDPVTVYVLHQVFSDVTALDELAALMREEPVREHFSCPVETVFADFRESLQRATNLQLRGEAVENCADVPEFLRSGSMRKFYRELSTNRILTVTRVNESCISQLLKSSPYESRKLAVGLCHAWLREALYGRYLSVDVRTGNVAVTGAGSVAFKGQEFIELSQHTKENLRHYLLATLVDDPDRAALHLLQEMHPPRDGMQEAAEFRSKFRQAAYFGALEPVLGTDTNALAQLIFQHWKTALEFGYKPSPDFLCFYRGLFSVARAARELTPEDDPLRDGLEELDADVMFGEFAEIAGTDYWSKNADKFAMAMANLPQILDEAINHAAGGSLEDSATKPEVAAGMRAKPVSAVVLFIAVAVFLVIPTFYQWPEQAVTIALMIAGLLGLQTCEG